MTGAYERELREVLAGTDKGVHAVTKRVVRLRSNNAWVE